MATRSEYQKAWREKNKEKIALQLKLYYQENKEKLKERSIRNYYLNHEDSLRKAKEFRDKKRGYATSERGFKKGHIPWHKGTKGVVIANSGSFSKDDKRILGENSYSWKGVDVGYRGLHNWIENELGKPDICSNCERRGLSGHQIHWANKSREYKREISDWIRLCAKCHKAFDRKEVSMFK